MLRITLEHCLQSTNRARLIQLKNEVNNIFMGSQTMSQYPSQIKTIVDLIVPSRKPLDLIALQSFPQFAFNPQAHKI